MSSTTKFVTMYGSNSGDTCREFWRDLITPGQNIATEEYNDSAYKPYPYLLVSILGLSVYQGTSWVKAKYINAW